MKEHVWNYVVNKKCKTTQNMFYIIDCHVQSSYL